MPINFFIPDYVMKWDRMLLSELQNENKWIIFGRKDFLFLFGFDDSLCIAELNIFMRFNNI